MSRGYALRCGLVQRFTPPRQMFTPRVIASQRRRNASSSEPPSSPLLHARSPAQQQQRRKDNTRVYFASLRVLYIAIQTISTENSASASESRQRKAKRTACDLASELASEHAYSLCKKITNGLAPSCQIL